MDVRLPELGEGIESATVVNVLVRPGSELAPGQDVIEVETEKASMPVPAPAAGTVEQVLVKPGDKIAVGQAILRLAETRAAGKGQPPAPPRREERRAAPATKPAPAAAAPAEAGPAERLEFKLPNLGEGITAATVVAVPVKPGDTVSAGQTLLEVETEKASLAVPAPAAGKVEDVRVKTGQSVAVGDVVAVLSVTESAPASGVTSAPRETDTGGSRHPARPEASSGNGAAAKAPAPAPTTAERAVVSAGPATRRLARELGVDLRAVPGSARGGRVTIDDVKGFVRGRLARPVPAAPTGGALVIPPLPDFSKYGPVERQPFSALRKAIARNLTLAWQVAPAVTQHDTADITDLEAARKRFLESAEKGTPKVMMTTLAIKACVAALKAFPQFNASYDPHAGENGELVLKRYYHIGVAVDTERGLVVPVVRDADQKSTLELARAVTELAEKARAGKLTPDDMKGGTFTITNLGGIGGDYFSPILNYPEVAILGLSRSALKPVVRDGQVEPRLLLPLSLTYDHRVIDGAAGARFITRLVQLLSEPTRLIFES